MSAQITGWATIAQNINSASYTANWGVDFFALPDGVSYIAVYSAKSNGPVSAATEVFYIKRILPRHPRRGRSTTEREPTRRSRQTPRSFPQTGARPPT